MAKFLINNSFAKELINKVAPFCEGGYIITFAKNSKGDGIAQIVASTKFDKCELQFEYALEGEAELPYKITVGKNFADAIAALSIVGKDFILTEQDGAVIIKSGTAVSSVPVLDGPIVTITAPKKENSVMATIKLSDFREAVNNAFIATQEADEEPVIALFPGEESKVAMFATNNVIISKNELTATPSNQESWDALKGVTLAVKAKELKRIISELEAVNQKDEIRLCISTKDQLLMIQARGVVYSFKLLAKGFPFTKERIEGVIESFSNGHSFIAVTEEFRKGLKIAAALQDGKKRIALNFNAEKKMLAVTSAYDKSCGMSIKIKDAEAELGTIRACFDPKFLASILPADTDVKLGISEVGERYALYIKDNKKAFILCCVTDPEKEAEKTENSEEEESK